MRYVHLSQDTIAQQLAADEALLDWRATAMSHDLLRMWEPQEYAVILGRSNAVATAVALDQCVARNIPIFRRSTGGGAVLIGPGCVNYTLVLHVRAHPELALVRSANRFIMQRHHKALTPLCSVALTLEGDTDLALKGRKCSGNAQRRTQDYLLFHGSFLLAYDPALMEAVLPVPSQQPLYRQARSHRDFLGTLPLSAATLQRALRDAWGASQEIAPPLHQQIAHLASTKYLAREWTFKH